MADPETVGTDLVADLQPWKVDGNHILHCSYDYWYPIFRQHCVESKIIPIPQVVVDYLEEDGIIAVPEEEEQRHILWSDASESHINGNETLQQYSDDSDGDSEDANPLNLTPPYQRFPEFHKTLRDSIAELGGAVVVKLNWTAPRDAAFKPADNTLRCTNPCDIYLMLKSSNFMSHDLSHAFDHCNDSWIANESCATLNTTSLPYAPVLVLKRWTDIVPSLEFRCFVKQNTLIGLSQRDPIYYQWLTELRPLIVAKIEDFWERSIRGRFPDSTYVFDVFIAEDRATDSKLGRVWLMDFNPWAYTTDPLLFTWQELLYKPVLSMPHITGDTHNQSNDSDSSSSELDDDETPELRLMDQQELGHRLRASDLSAHKMPLEVVEAGMTPGQMAGFLHEWIQQTRRVERSR